MLMILFGLLFFFKGVDEATITEILTKRSNAQRQAIKAAYQSSTGKVSTVILPQKWSCESMYIVFCEMTIPLSDHVLIAMLLVVSKQCHCNIVT